MRSLLTIRRDRKERGQKNEDERNEDKDGDCRVTKNVPRNDKHRRIATLTLFARNDKRRRLIARRRGRPMCLPEYLI